jgi:hypothetical protein
MDTVDVAAKRRSLFHNRFQAERYKSGLLTIEWLNDWISLFSRTISSSHSRHIRVIPQTLEYLRIYFHEWVHMKPQGQAENGRVFKRKLYDTS